MGMPFPTGLRALAAAPAPEFPAGRDASNNAVEWAWAMNAAASVLGSVLAMVIAIQFGLTVTLACGAAAYLLALVLLPGIAPESGLALPPSFVIILRWACGAEPGVIRTVGAAGAVHRNWRDEEIICLARSSSNGRNFALGSR